MHKSIAMLKNYKLSNFFLCVFLFVLCLVGYVAYTHRTNSVANLSEDVEENEKTKEKKEITIGSFFNSPNREGVVDVSSPFYALHKSEAEMKEEKKEEGKEKAKSEEKKEDSKESAKPEEKKEEAPKTAEPAKEGETK